jgi:uncharacterized membrane protein YfcA
LEASPDWLSQGLLFLIALIANSLSAFAGGGAGLLQLPVLIFLGLSFSVALATHKVATVALGLGATVRNLREGHLQARLTLFTLLCGIPGVILGGLVIVNVPDRAAQIALGVLNIGLGIYSVAKRELGLAQREVPPTRAHQAIGGAVLFVIGILNGSLASGTGLFVTLWLVGWFGMDYKRAVAHTLVLVGLFWNGAGALTLAMVSQIHWQWLPALLAGSLLGGYLGAHLAIRSGNRWIKRAFELLTLGVGIKLILG